MARLFRTIILSTVTLVAVLFITTIPVQAGIVVPGDFPGDFTMDLLTMNLYLDNPETQSFEASIPVALNELGINFSASAFDNPSGNPNYGTSTLTASGQDFPFEIGSGMYNGLPLTFYIAGGGPGTLTDLGNGTGNWELTVPIYANYDGTDGNPISLHLSTAASYDYYVDASGNTATVSGTAMNYENGDLLMVGQVLCDSPIFEGLRGTFVMQGNDPFKPPPPPPIPEPASMILMATGLAGLLGMRRK